MHLRRHLGFGSMSSMKVVEQQVVVVGPMTYLVVAMWRELVAVDSKIEQRQRVVGSMRSKELRQAELEAGSMMGQLDFGSMIGQFEIEVDLEHWSIVWRIQRRGLLWQRQLQVLRPNVR